MAEGVYYYGLVKMSHKGFCISTLEKLMKYWLIGSYIVMKSNKSVPGGRPLMIIR